MRASDNMTLIAALLARTPMWSVDLFTFTLTDNTVYRFCSGDADVIWSGITWSAAGPAIQRSSWSVKNTTEVPELEIKMLTTGSDFAVGNLKTLLHNGLLDGATIILDRAFMPTYGDTSLGIVTLFGGRAGKIQITGVGATITCVSVNVLMSQNLPRNTFQLGCVHTLYDSGCTLNRASFTVTLTVSSSVPLTLGVAETISSPSNYLQGTMIILNGAGAGQRRTIQATAANAVGFSYPLLTLPSAGDHISISQGCDKSTAACARFANSAHFRGFPYIPPASSGF